MPTFFEFCTRNAKIMDNCPKNEVCLLNNGHLFCNSRYSAFLELKKKLKLAEMERFSEIFPKKYESNHRQTMLEGWLRKVRLTRGPNDAHSLSYSWVTSWLSALLLLLTRGCGWRTGCSNA